MMMRPRPQRHLALFWFFALLLLLQSAVAAAGPANLRRRPPGERIHEPGAKGRPGADARPVVDATLRTAGLPEGAENNPWRELIHQYWRLDHMAQGEPRSFTEGKFVPNAWFTHGARHFMDLANLMENNKDFIRDIWHAQGLTGEAAKDQAFRDLLIALIGHDSQQLGFASPRENVREQARNEHPFNGGVATAVAYLQAAGTNPAGAERALMLALAASGHSKSAVDFEQPNRQPTQTSRTRGSAVMLDALLAEVNAQMRQLNPSHVNITFNATQRAAIIDSAKKIGTVLGAMDALRERGPEGWASNPTGEHMIYRVVSGEKALEVFNTKEGKRVVKLEGVTHRSYIEYHTVVEALSFDGRTFEMRINFADPDIPTTSAPGAGSRLTQVEDIQRDLARTGFPCVVRYRTFEGTWARFPAE